jgi:hypothetical protein
MRTVQCEPYLNRTGPVRVASGDGSPLTKVDGMNASGDDPSRVAPQLHELLLRLAGRVPDEVLTTSRQALGGGELGRLARLVTGAVLEYDIVLDRDDERLVRRLLIAHGADPAVLSDVDLLAATSARYSFAPSSPAPADRARDRAAVSAAGPAVAAADAAVAAVGAVAGALGMWRAWRSGAAGQPETAPCPVYLVEVAADADPVAATVLLQRALTAAGSTNPQVEVFLSRAELPSYQTLALASSELLWARSPAPEIRVVERATGVGSQPREDDLVRDDEQRRRLVDYLRSGEPLLVSEAREADVVDQARGTVVPVNFRTDGTWVWTDAVTYYLDEHRLRPEADLVKHIRSRRFRPPELGGVEIWRAMAALTESGHDETASRDRAEAAPSRA